jgi:hypothetical protein
LHTFTFLPKTYKKQDTLPTIFSITYLKADSQLFFQKSKKNLSRTKTALRKAGFPNEAKTVVRKVRFGAGEKSLC